MSGLYIDEWEAIARSAPPRPPEAAPAPRSAADIEAARLRAKRQQREQRERDHARWIAEYPRNTGVAAMFLHKDLDDLDQVTDEQRTAVDACWDFANTWEQRRRAGQHTSLWFLGDIATGKTRIVSALATVLYVDYGVSVRIVETRDLITSIRDTWHGGPRHGQQAAVLREFVEVEVLVLDDLGGDSRGTENEQQVLFDVINGRYKAGLPTLLTSNEDSEGLLKVLGKRSYSRLMDGMRVLPLTEKKYRQPAPVSPDLQDPNARAHTREGG